MKPYLKGVFKRNVSKFKFFPEFVTEMMCSTVVSDSEAFKAANPNARFEDFIRWFSPNDWEEYMDEELGVKRYRLSARMRAAGNTWQTVWEQAKPVPVSRQVGTICNFLTEANKILKKI